MNGMYKKGLSSETVKSPATLGAPCVDFLATGKQSDAGTVGKFMSVYKREPFGKLNNQRRKSSTVYVHRPARERR